MRIRIVLHSTTGNTRLVTRYAAGWLKTRGHTVKIHDIVGRPEPPALDDTDLLVVACPTMYFRPTLAMERFVARLPSVPEGGRRPAWLLGTCMGEPGAHFALLAEQLDYKGWRVVGAHWVLSPSNYPTHLVWMSHLRLTAGLRPLLDRLTPALRPLWWTIWPSGESGERDRLKLDRALERLLARAEGDLDQVPAPNSLYRGIPACNTTGRLFPKELIDQMVRIRIDPARCTRCGTCVKHCPVGVITQESEDALPRVGTGCTGCFACYNHCADHAISAIATPAGRGVYPGPGPSMREVFQATR